MKLTKFACYAVMQEVTGLDNLTHTLVKDEKNNLKDIHSMPSVDQNQLSCLIPANTSLSKITILK